MKVKLKLLGHLRTASGMGELILDLPDGTTVGEAIEEGVKSLPAGLRTIFGNPAAPAWASSAVVLVSGREVSCLGGIGAKAREGDEIVLLPVVHSG